MRLVITRIGNDVDLENPQNMRFHLLVECASGKEIRVPATKEVVDELMAEAYARESAPQPAWAPSDRPAQDPQERSYENQEVEPTPAPPQDDGIPQLVYDEDDGPASEEEVPTL